MSGPAKGAVSKSRQQSRDADATKARILDAAEEEFARNGLLGARTEDIAAKTGVTKAMIYYYYHSKENLYQAVLERALVSRIRQAQEINIDSLGALEALKTLVIQIVDNSSKNTNLPKIMLYEAIQNKGKYYKEVGAVSWYGVLIKILERGMATKVFRKLDPTHTAVNIVGLCVFYFCARENIKHLWPGQNLLGEEMLEQHKQDALDFIVAGVRA